MPPASLPHELQTGWVREGRRAPPSSHLLSAVRLAKSPSGVTSRVPERLRQVVTHKVEFSAAFIRLCREGRRSEPLILSAIRIVPGVTAYARALAARLSARRQILDALRRELSCTHYWGEKISARPYAHAACSYSGLSFRSCGIRTASRITSFTVPNCSTYSRSISRTVLVASVGRTFSSQIPLNNSRFCPNRSSVS